MEKIGFIGLGIMGKPMAKNLLRAGFPVQAFDVNQKAVQELAECGAIPAGSIAAAVEEADIVITMLPNSPQVRQVALGEGGLREKMSPDALYIDMSSIAPGAAREVAAALAEKGIHMLDAPVSGGEPKAVDGTLAIMVGGKEKDFLRAQPVFSVLGSSALLIGEVGSGNVCKLTNQVIVAANIAALAEGLTLAQNMDVDPEKVFQAIKGGLAGSTVMDAKAPMMLEHSFPPGFRIDLHVKDLGNALESGQLSGSPMPVARLTMDMLQYLQKHGFGSEDHSALFRWYEGNTGITEECM